MSNNLFALSNYVYKLDSLVAGKYYLIEFGSTTGVPALTPANVVELVCNVDIKETSQFPTDNFPNCTKIKIQGWLNLSSFVVNSAMLANINELQLSQTNVSTLSQNFTSVDDLILSNNEILNSITNSFPTLIRMIIINCPISSLPTIGSGFTALTTLHLEKTNVTSLPVSMTALKYLYLSPKYVKQNFNVQTLSNIVDIITRTDVNLQANSASHIAYFA